MTIKVTMLKAHAFVLGQEHTQRLWRIAAELERSLLTADLAFDVKACAREIQLKLEALAGCAPGELWDDNGVPNLVYAAQAENKGELKPYQGVTVTRGRRRKQSPEGGVS